MPDNRAITRNRQAAWQIVEDKAVVVTPQTRKMHILSGAGALIWQLLGEPRRVEELVADLCREYDVSSPQARQDLESFLAQLWEKEAIEAA